MGASSGRAFPNPRNSNSFYGGPSLGQPQATIPGRRTMPGGPLLARLPQNPFAITAQKMAKLLAPDPPKNPNDMF
jgi:hypothetical protein